MKHLMAVSEAGLGLEYKSSSSAFSSFSPLHKTARVSYQKHQIHIYMCLPEYFPQNRLVPSWMSVPR
jgi:hypothetical protein